MYTVLNCMHVAGKHRKQYCLLQQMSSRQLSRPSSAGSRTQPYLALSHAAAPPSPATPTLARQLEWGLSSLFGPRDLPLDAPASELKMALRSPAPMPVPFAASPSSPEEDDDSPGPRPQLPGLADAPGSPAQPRALESDLERHTGHALVAPLTDVAMPEDGQTAADRKAAMRRRPAAPKPVRPPQGNTNEQEEESGSERHTGTARAAVSGPSPPPTGRSAAGLAHSSLRQHHVVLRQPTRLMTKPVTRPKVQSSLIL